VYFGRRLLRLEEAPRSVVARASRAAPVPSGQPRFPSSLSRHRGSYQMPQATQDGIELQPAQLAMLLSGIDLRTARQRKRFQIAG
jgi:hypothetical protein